MRAEEYEFPVSPAQARLLVLDQLHPGSAQYHVPVAFTVRGPFDVDAFRRAVAAVVARHESLRTGFRPVPGGYVQVVAAEVDAPVRVVAAGTEPEREMLAEASRPFDLAVGPLLRTVVYRVADGTHRILLTAHHLICDGWSMQIVLRDLATAYRGGSLPAPGVQYPDYAAWQNGRLAVGDYGPGVAYWRKLLDGVPATVDFPAAGGRPPVQRTDGGVERFVVPAGTRRRLAGAARDAGTTPFVVLLAVFSAFVARLAARDDVVIGVPVSGREHADTHDMVGLLTNTTALRVDVSGGPSLTDLVARVHAGVDAARPHQETPFHAVVDAVAPERQLSHDPVVQVVFGYDDDTALELDLPGARVDRLDVTIPEAKFDLLLHVERWEADLVGRFIYRRDLFAADVVRAWSRGFVRLLDELLDRPDEPVDAADAVSAADRRRILIDWNRTRAEVPDRLVPDLVAERAAERPEATALVCGDTVLTYAELLARADRLAASMRVAGVGPDVPVALCLPRSAEFAVAALAVVRAGGAYLPLDPDQPVARLRQMIGGVTVGLVLATRATAGRVTGLGVAVAELAEGATHFAAPPPVAPPRAVAAGGATAASLGYVLYTSGSTGTPKAVAVPHRALANLSTAVRRQFDVTTEDRVLQYVSFSFDVAVADLFFAWVAGAELHLAGEHERLGEDLYARLRDSRITFAFLPPAAAMSLPCPPGALPDLRILAVGGEPCPPELVSRWSVPGRTVLDAYGPSEACVYATTAVLAPGRPVVIGRPVANTRAYLLDARLRPVPAGVVGELYLAGAGLARGYLDRPAMTAERFTADPFGSPGDRMYRTGDLGWYDDAGTLRYLGRVDGQVKIRGFRIELGEVEAVLAGHPTVSVAVAMARGAGTDRRLVAYVVGVGGERPDPTGLRAWLADRLPSYLVPEVVVPVDELPLGRTGKLDRSALPEPPAARPELAQPLVAAATEVERRLMAVWVAQLGHDDIGVHDNFFDLGGNSIRMAAVLAELHRQGERELTMVDLFRFPTIASLAARIERSAAADPAAVDRAVARRRGLERRARSVALADRQGSTR